MKKRILKTLSVFVISLAILIWVKDIYEDRRNIVIIENSTWLYASPEDAASQDCTNCPPVTKIRKIEKNENLKVKKTTYGKDYWALKVETESGETGWVLNGQKGIKIKKI